MRVTTTKLISVIFLVLICSPDLAEGRAKYTATVQQVSDLRERVRTLALEPLDCTALKVDCLKLEVKLAERMASYGFVVVASDDVRQAEFELGEGTDKQLLEALSADALARATFVAETSADGTAVVGSGIFVEDEKKHSRVEIVFIDREGKELLAGMGQGRSGNDFKSQTGVVLKTFEAIFKKAFGD